MDKTEKNTKKAEIYQTYKEHLKEINAQQYDQQKEYDKNILLLAAGKFGVTFSFITDIVKCPKPETNILLLLSWTIDLTCILVSMLGFLLSISAHKQAINIWDISYLNKIWNIDHDKKKKEVEHTQLPKQCFIKILGAFSIIEYIAITSSCTLLLVYFFLNIKW